MSALEPNQPLQGKVKAQINWLCKIVGHRWEKSRYVTWVAARVIDRSGDMYKCTRKNCSSYWFRPKDTLDFGQDEDQPKNPN